MVTTEVFDKLKALQDILAEKYDLEAKINDSPKQLDVQSKLLQRLNEEYTEKKASYDQLRSKVAQLKADLAEAEALRENGEKGMDTITTHREYETLEKQINEASAREADIRRDLIREERNMSELDEALKSDEALMKSQEDEINEGKAALQSQIEGFQSELNQLNQQEAALTPGIDQEIILKFQRIIQRNRKGIVAVKGYVCDGCHMILPAQFANEVRAGDKVMFCPYCSRILFYEEPDGSSESLLQMDTVGSLADEDDEDEEDEDEEDESDEDSDDGDSDDFGDDQD